MRSKDNDGYEPLYAADYSQLQHEEDREVEVEESGKKVPLRPREIHLVPYHSLFPHPLCFGANSSSSFGQDCL